MIDEELKNSIENIVRSKNLNLYDIELLKEDGELILRISIHKQDGITLEHCEEISNLLSPILDVKLDSLENYFLEVSSPGSERILKNKIHFKYSVGELIEIKTKNKEKIEGILESFDEENIFIKANGATKNIPLQECKRIKTKIKF